MFPLFTFALVNRLNSHKLCILEYKLYCLGKYVLTRLSVLRHFSVVPKQYPEGNDGFRTF